MNCTNAQVAIIESDELQDRRQHQRVDIPAAAVVAGQSGENPHVVTTRILNLSQSGANVVSETRFDSDTLWLAFTTDERLILEAEVVWRDDTTDSDCEFYYGVRFIRSLREDEFVEVINVLKSQPVQEIKLAPTLRQREESLYSLFRGHSPQGARSK